MVQRRPNAGAAQIAHLGAMGAHPLDGQLPLPRQPRRHSATGLMGHDPIGIAKRAAGLRQGRAPMVEQGQAMLQHAGVIVFKVQHAAFTRTGVRAALRQAQARGWRVLALPKIRERYAGCARAGVVRADHHGSGAIAHLQKVHPLGRACMQAGGIKKDRPGFYPHDAHRCRARLCGHGKRHLQRVGKAGARLAQLHVRAGVPHLARNFCRACRQ